MEISPARRERHARRFRLLDELSQPARPTAHACCARARDDGGASITLTNGQITSVRAYYSNMPSGNARGRGRGRNGGLPPGIARNLARGKALPPGIAKGYLPSAVIADLPRLPSGLDYIIVAGKLLLVEAATQVVREVLLDLAFDS